MKRDKELITFNKSVKLTLPELQEKLGLSVSEMARQLGIPRQELSRAINEKPPKWMTKGKRFAEFLEEAGFLPSQIEL